MICVYTSGAWSVKIAHLFFWKLLKQIDMEKIVEKEITIEKMFESMKAGDIYKVPYEKSRHNAIRAECSRQHRYARERGVKVTSLTPVFRVSARENKGYTTIIKLRDV